MNMKTQITFKTAKGTELPLIDLRGKDYLQVAHRLVWFREEHPDWSINTEFVKIDASMAIAKATILTPSGQIMSTAHKCEDKQGFADFLEKAETGAIGRALAMVGYGTQFAPDLDEQHRIVDSPLDTKHQQIKVPYVGDNNPHNNCTCGSPLKYSDTKQVYYCPDFQNKAVPHIKPFK